MSEASGADPEHVAPVAPEVADSDVPAESAVDAPAATDQPEAGLPTATPAAVVIPDPVTVPVGQGHAGLPDASTAAADPRVDDALSRRGDRQPPFDEQVEVYTDIHRRLAGVLADPDSQA